MQKIRVGSVGLGSISKGVHLPGITRSPDLELAALCDSNPAVLEARQKEYGIDDAHCFTNYQDLIACKDVEAVDISTPNDVHFPIAMAAALAGKPFSLEKPITLDHIEADRLATVVQEKGLPNMVCFSYRFKAAARYARDLILSGTLGDIYHVNMQYFQAWGLPCREIPLVWRYIKARTGSGALGDLGSHGLDLVRFVTGKDYRRVVGHLGTYVKERRTLDGKEAGIVDVDDFSNYMAEMEGDISASFQITRFAWGRGNYQRMEIYGSKGALVYKLDETPGEDEISVCIGAPYDLACTFTKLPVPEKYRSDQMQSFADILLNKADRQAATILDGQKNQATMDAIIESAIKEHWITL